jgi:enoyl-CoA hydratase/carnithine racemase
MSQTVDLGVECACARLERKGGILELHLNTDGGPFIWGDRPHRELPELFAAIARARDVHVLLITGTGESFCDAIDVPSFSASSLEGYSHWDRPYWDASRLLKNLVDIEALVIGAINGPARFHAELGVLSDIVLCSTTTVFQEEHHFQGGLVPGDGTHIVWPELLGPNRGRYFVLTGQEVTAAEALQLGIVSEVVTPEELLPRARALAEDLMRKPPLTLRYTRLCFIQPWRRRLAEDLSHGLLLEGAAQTARREARAEPGPR